MGVFTWTVPAPASSSPSSGSPSSIPNAEKHLKRRTFGFFDMEIDPESRDYIDTTDGEWSETEDSRTAVMMQLDIRYGEWHADPDAGSRINALVESGMLMSDAGILQLVDEARRALQVLVDDGIIADLTVDTGDIDFGAGRVELTILYTDRSSGHVVDVVYSPF